MLQPTLVNAVADETHEILVQPKGRGRAKDRDQTGFDSSGLRFFGELKNMRAHGYWYHRDSCIGGTPIL